MGELGRASAFGLGHGLRDQRLGHETRLFGRADRAADLADCDGERCWCWPTYFYLGLAV